MDVLWMVPLALAGLLTLIGAAGSWWRSRKRRRRTRPAWDVPRGVTAYDVADAYYHHHPEEDRRTAAFIRAVIAVQRLNHAFQMIGTSFAQAAEQLRKAGA